ncbi:Protein LURP-one-related 6 [Linum perenne]
MAPVAIISKLYCSATQVVLTVRKRPHVICGGGFVVTNCSQKVVFRVEGCGVLGSIGELIVRDTEGDALLLIRRKEGVVQALSINRKWKGYSFDYEGIKKMVFKLKEPNSCLARNSCIRICTEPRRSNTSDWDFEVQGQFPDKDACIVDHLGHVIAQIGVEKGMRSMDMYYVVVKPGIDQAFVFGVIAVLDNIYGESTTC